MVLMNTPIKQPLIYIWSFMSQLNKTQTNSHTLIQVKKPNTAQKKINKLWQQIQKQKRLNTKLQKDVDSSIQHYQKLIMPIEIAHVLPAKVALAERLITLFERKSLSDWHRDHMARWIGDLVEDIRQWSNEQAMTLHNSFSDIAHKVMTYGMSEEEIAAEKEQERENMQEMAEEIFGEDVETPKEGWDMDFLMQALLKKRFTDLMQEQGVDVNDIGYDDSNAETNNKQSAAAKKDLNATNLDNWVSKIFRQTAKQLHPDKFQDEQQKTHHQELMTKLSKARDENNIATIIEMYMTHVGDLDSIAGQDDKALLNALTQQLNHLKAQYDEIEDKNFLTPHAMQRLQNCEKKQDLLKKWQDEIKAEADSHTEQLQFLKNLTLLKETLKVRRDYEHRNRMRFAGIDESLLDEIFGF